MSGELVYLDAGVLVNLCATKQAADILLGGAYRCAIVEAMREEPLSIWVEDQEGSEELRSEPLPVDTLLRSNALELHPFPFESCGEIFVYFAVAFRDVHAKMLALAVTNQAAVATDDRYMRRELHQLIPDISVLSTLNFLQAWQQNLHISDKEMQSLLQNIDRRAFFLPADDDPLASWWGQLVK